MMKIFVIGGTTMAATEPGYPEELQLLNRSMNTSGKDVIRGGHDLLACSPFPGSADQGVINGAVDFLRDKEQVGAAVELHFPESPEIVSQLRKLTESVPAGRARFYSYPTSSDEQGQTQWEYSWLLAQLAAMDRSHAIVSIGGRLSGPANMLLTLAEGRHKHILPIAFLGGASAESFRRRRYELEDRLGNRAASLQEIDSIPTALSLIEDLTRDQLGKSVRAARLSLFISYPRSKPEEADFVEMVLRRRNVDVYRDENDFGPGRSIPNEIIENIHRSNVFIVIWCKEYACSPWCHDEFELALQRSLAGGLTLWILCVDDTRVVPPAARDLVNYPSRTREELERHILTLLERSQTQ